MGREPVALNERLALVFEMAQLVTILRDKLVYFEEHPPEGHYAKMQRAIEMEQVNKDLQFLGYFSIMYKKYEELCKSLKAKDTDIPINSSSE